MIQNLAGSQVQSDVANESPYFGCGRLCYRGVSLFHKSPSLNKYVVELFTYEYSPNSACTTEGFLLGLYSNSLGNRKSWSSGA